RGRTSPVGARPKPPGEILRETGRPVERWNQRTDEPPVSVRIAGQGPPEGLGETCPVQFLRVDPLGEPARRERLRSNLLLDLVRGPRYDHEGSTERQGLADAVVAPHADDRVGRCHELRVVRARDDPAPPRSHSRQAVSKVRETHRLRYQDI